jgi:hypothetical protein
VAHAAVIFANAIMHSGTTVDAFLRDNLDWLRCFPLLCFTDPLHVATVKVCWTALSPTRCRCAKAAPLGIRAEVWKNPSSRASLPGQLLKSPG